MASSFGGLNTALTSLYAQRRGLDISGQNVANANTEGYTRQKVRMQSQTGSLNPGVYATTTQVGNGVTVSSVERGRNEYLEQRGRTEHANSSYLATQKGSYEQIESVLAEPSDTALQARMHDMWDAWNDVANNWQDPSTRTALIERSQTVATTLNDTHASLDNQFTTNRTQAQAFVSQVNNLSSQIADMNQQIVVAHAAGLEANELMDQRDMQIMQLSELTGATTQSKTNGAVNVFLGTAPLVSDFSTRTVELTGPPSLAAWTEDNQVALKWTDTDAPVTTGGQMGAMFDTMNNIIPTISGQLDDVAASLAKTVNDAVMAGYDKNGDEGTAFFEGTTAGEIKVLITTPDKVAFSAGNPKDLDPEKAAIDHGIADSLAEMAVSPDGPDSVYQSMIGKLGVASQASARRSDIQNAVTDQVDTARQAESGVNLDEEMTNLLTFQRGYEAASRVLTTIDSMLDQLINRTGLVGR
ncbi:flagellar hook-associated protein FlgK [Paractinoplanes atraurantiacus]|uniref:Flagellar hook-associated protein 1 n=1 Tax=Paractinoplanes atraurantiacus TaxID=1036182 RepID=A0A285F2A0_9ACTN|nr:flagellar hook-associated protein FlgK [Actinoplanes atraurantiacus]SNY05183.1 flagellar hook-associated protein 1 FlgK [Actinoplanes atraurantiacus]